MKKVLLVFLSLSILATTAQDDSKTLIEKTSLSGLKFRNVGPALTSGRIADIAVNPNDYSEYYVAVASGGVWKTNNHGTTFTPIFDSQNSYSIGCVTIDPTNDNVVWVGSGENNGQRSVAYGDGVYKSTDGGSTWKNMGLKTSEHIGMIAIHPTNSNIVYIAATGPVWSSGGDRGIYKTTDGGQNWEKVLNVSEHTGFNEIHLDHNNPDILYATAHQRRRHVWTYVSGGPESALYKSTDGGKSWVKLENGLPAGDKGRIALALPKTDTDRIYAMVEGHGTYRSDDRGASFTKQNDYYTSGNYYVELVGHPHNADIVYSMDTWLHVSQDGGKSWQKVPEKLKHVDNHCLWINPDNTNHMIAGCDGGIYETYDNAENWEFKPNLPVTQFYRVTVDNSEPFYHIHGGTQDNFSLGGPSRTINSRGIVNSDWYVTSTGDGFESQIDPKNPNIVYAQAQYGYLSRYDRVSGESVGIRPEPAKGAPAYRWNWDAPLLISPHNHKTLYFAANKVFKSTDMGSSWIEISGDLTQQIDRHKLPVMGKVQSVDAIAYDKSTSQYGNIVALDESPLKQGLIYIGTDDGLIQVTEDGGQNWRKQQGFPGIPKNTYVNQVLASLYDENTVYAVFNNHKNGDFKPYILKSTDKGKSWKSIQTNLPANGAVFTLKQDHVNKNLLFAGTEFGVFFTVDGGANWNQLKAGIPTIAIRDMDIQKRENDLVLASFGRGFYVLDDYSPLRELSNDLLEKDVHLFEIKDGLVYHEAQPLGYGKTGFQGASYYAADNPPVGTVFTYYLKDAPKSLADKRKEKEKELNKNNSTIPYPSEQSLRDEDNEEQAYLLFSITNSNGKEISRFTKAASAGIARVTWDGTYSSVANLSNSGAPLTAANSANLALPGIYSVTIYKSVNGQTTKLTEPKSFTLKWLNNNSLLAKNTEELLAFQRQAEEVNRKITGLESYINHLTSKIEKLKAAARNTPNIPLTTLDSLRKLEVKMDEVKIRIYGDESLAKRDFETPPSLLNRMGTVIWNSYSTTTAPTGAQKQNLAIATEEYQEIRSIVKSISDSVNSLQSTLTKAGAPYQPDELPE